MSREEEIRKYPEPGTTLEMREQEALRDDLIEIADLMEAYVREALVTGDGHQADRSAWLLLYITLKLDAEFIHLLDLRMQALDEDELLVDELQAIAVRMEAHVRRADALGGGFYTLRSAWFLAYTAIKLSGRYCHSLDVRLSELSDEALAENMLLRDDN